MTCVIYSRNAFEPQHRILIDDLLAQKAKPPDATTMINYAK
jgi:hypothetical protein